MKKSIRCLRTLVASTALTASMTCSVMPVGQLVPKAMAAGDVNITYVFAGDEREKAGYAQGTLSVSSTSDGTYHLYWADDEKVLPGYYEINSKLRQKLTGLLGGTKFEGTGFIVKAGGAQSFTFGEQTAIPAGATKIIAVTDTNTTKVSDAVAVYDIPKNKQLSAGSGKLLYKFNSYSDVHLDCKSSPFWTKSEARWKKALAYAAKKDAEFIASSGDMATSSNAKEWKMYKKAVVASDFTGNIWEANGNHDLKTSNVKDGIREFIYAAGTNGTSSNYTGEIPYYFMVEENSGDVFIFMALEKSGSPGESEEFSSTQIKWLRNVLDTYYGTGVNVYIVEHATFKGWGVGDDWNYTYYGGHMNATGTNKDFQDILKKYKDVIFINGHTHQDFSLTINYSDDDGKACHMVHNPANAGTTYSYKSSASDKITGGSQQYHSPSALMSGGQDGAGYNSQGYYVETYENEVVFYGSDVEAQLIYPEYCYIMEGARASATISNSGDGTALQPDLITFKLVSSTIDSNASLNTALNAAKSAIDKYPDLCSFDQYTNLKKLYTQNKDNALIVNESVIVEKIKRAIEELEYIAIKTGKSSGKIESESSTGTVAGRNDSSTGGITDAGDTTECSKFQTYYFVNKGGWSSVSCYAWKSGSSSSNNAEWPGVKLTKVGRQDGYDVYKMDLGSKTMYDSIIFNNSQASAGKQTVDISLSDYSNNCFVLGDKSTSTGGSTKYKVTNTSYSE